MITGTKEVESVETRGETTIRNIAGKVTASHRGGELTLGDLGALKLTANGTDVKLSRVRGDTTIQARAGEIVAERTRGGGRYRGQQHRHHRPGARGLEGSGPCHGYQWLGPDSRRAHRYPRRRPQRRGDRRRRAACAGRGLQRGGESIELTAPPRRLPARCGLHRRRPDHGARVLASGHDRGQRTACLRSRQRRRPDHHAALDPGRDRGPRRWRPGARRRPAPPRPPRPPSAPKLERKLEPR